MYRLCCVCVKTSEGLAIWASSWIVSVLCATEWRWYVRLWRVVYWRTRRCLWRIFVTVFFVLRFLVPVSVAFITEIHCRMAVTRLLQLLHSEMDLEQTLDNSLSQSASNSRPLFVCLRLAQHMLRSVGLLSGTGDLSKAVIREPLVPVPLPPESLCW